MNTVQAGQIGVEVTQIPGQLWGVRVYDSTSGIPTLVTGLPGNVNNVVPMSNFYGSTYYAEFPGFGGKRYAVNKAVYTDTTYTTIDSNQPQGSDTYQVIFPTGPIAADAPIGIVNPSVGQQVTGVVAPQKGPPVGFVEE